MSALGCHQQMQAVATAELPLLLLFDRVSEPRSVNMWLGANVMVEYPLEEAKELLGKNLSNAETNLDVINK